MRDSTLFICPMANGIAEFGSHEIIRIPGETLEPVCHRVFILHEIRGKDSCLGDELSSPIMCQMKHWWIHGSTCVKAKCASVSGKVLLRLGQSPRLREKQSFSLQYVSCYWGRLSSHSRKHSQTNFTIEIFIKILAASTCMINSL